MVTHTCIPVLTCRDRQSLRLTWPANVSKITSIRFSEGTLFQTLRWKVTKEDMWVTSASGLHTHQRTYVMCVSTHLCAHAFLSLWWGVASVEPEWVQLILNTLIIVSNIILLLPKWQLGAAILTFPSSGTHQMDAFLRSDIQGPEPQDTCDTNFCPPSEVSSAPPHQLCPFLCSRKSTP